MEKFRSCPICLEVPEGDIFQCTAGHMICSICITKVERDLCPQCRIPFGTPKIRSRILEEILDSQEFLCGFSDNGCTQLCKRAEVTKHAKSCCHNPDTVSICKQLGFSSCEFQLGSVSRAEVISHFENTHKCPFQKTSGNWGVRLPGDHMMRTLGKKRKEGASKIPNDTVNLLTPPGASETSPLFLFISKINWTALSVSFAVVKVWETPSLPPVKYDAKFVFHKKNSTTGSQPGSSSSTIKPIDGVSIISNMKF
ncbi:E3 ubiquitin-protein ligase siah-1 [Orchesella cincta]|uniref:RING-type E3 ubiquitin transferase n=1 Tax=Orchesella cincta TaxID=48709 RepID=A0A1D2MBI9_ORCCI|nr:E3 ubiquitin-protein ligase siah-1 [Orchesella cincta]